MAQFKVRTWSQMKLRGIITKVRFLDNITPIAIGNQTYRANLSRLWVETLHTIAYTTFKRATAKTNECLFQRTAMKSRSLCPTVRQTDDVTENTTAHQFCIFTK